MNSTTIIEQIIDELIKVNEKIETTTDKRTELRHKLQETEATKQQLETQRNELIDELIRTVNDLRRN